MRRFALVGFLTALTCLAQPAAPNSAQASAPVPVPAPAAAQTIRVPAGTRIPLALISPITGSARAGNTVRAVTGFPIAVGAQLAIPAGAHVEGVIDKVSKRGPSGPSVEMHFSCLVYANGYSVAIDGAQVEAKLQGPEGSSQDSGTLAQNRATHPLFALPQTPSLPPVSNPGPNIAAVTGATIGAGVALTVAGVLLHRRGTANKTLFEAGWQFEMVLQTPLLIDLAKAAPA